MRGGFSAFVLADQVAVSYDVVALSDDRVERNVWWRRRVTCRVALHCTLVEASRFVPATTVMLEPVDKGVLLTTHYPEENLERLALYLLEFPVELDVLEPAGLHDALVSIAGRALKLADRP